MKNKIIINNGKVKINVTHEKGVVKKGEYIIFKTGDNKADYLQKNDIMLGVFHDPKEGKEVYSSAQYLGGDLLNNDSISLFNPQNLN